MESDMLYVAEGILDEAAKEYREENLASAAAVAQYAFGGCDIVLTEEECEKVLAACRAWLASDRFSSYLYDTLVVEPLS
jgi:hypothetical protein